MIRRAWRDGFVHVASAFAYETRAQGEAPLALTESSPEARVPLDRFNVAVATIHGRLEFVKRDVFASTNESLHGRVSGNILARPRKSGWHLCKKWLAPLATVHKCLAPCKSLGYTGRMPQKPRVRAKQKVRQTRRLAKWRAKQQAQAAQQETAAKPAS